MIGCSRLSITKGNFIKNIRETSLGEGYCPSKFVFNIHKVALENFPSVVWKA